MYLCFYLFWYFVNTAKEFPFQVNTVGLYVVLCCNLALGKIAL